MHLYEPIESEEKLESSIKLAFRLPTANERMVEAFAEAAERKNWERLQQEPMNGNLQRAFG